MGLSGQNTEKLLASLATALEAGQDITWWLRENNVSANDLMPTLNQAAAIIRSYLCAPEQIQTAMLVAGVSGRRIGKIAWANSILSFASKHFHDQLEKFSK